MPKVMVLIGAGIPLLFLKQMPDRLYWMVYDHPGAGESHHLAYPFPHVFPVTVRWAFLAPLILYDKREQETSRWICQHHR